MKTHYPAPAARPSDGIYKVRTGEWKLEEPSLNTKECTACGICYIFCPTKCIYKSDDHYEIDFEWCKGCGICASECPIGAIEMQER